MAIDASPPCCKNHIHRRLQARLVARCRRSALNPALKRGWKSVKHFLGKLSCVPFPPVPFDSSGKTGPSAPSRSLSEVPDAPRRAARLAIQRPDPEFDAIVITTLFDFPFDSHAQLVWMTRPQVVRVALAMNTRLPLAGQIPVPLTASTAAIRGHIEDLVGMRRQTEASEASEMDLEASSGGGGRCVSAPTELEIGEHCLSLRGSRRRALRNYVMEPPVVLEPLDEVEEEPEEKGAVGDDERRDEKASGDVDDVERCSDAIPLVWRGTLLSARFRKIRRAPQVWGNEIEGDRVADGKMDAEVLEPCHD